MSPWAVVRQRAGALGRDAGRWLGIVLLCLGLVSCHASPSHPSWQGSGAMGPRHELAPLSCAPDPATLTHWQAEQLAWGYPAEHLSTWITPAPVPERAVALLVHGLNLRPSRMQPLAQALAQQGIRVLRVTLHGHGCHYQASSSEQALHLSDPDMIKAIETKIDAMKLATAILLVPWRTAYRLFARMSPDAMEI